MNPGSPEAGRNGCTCPVLDNGHGRGTALPIKPDGSPQFWQSQNCPLHGTNLTKNQEVTK